MKEINCNTKAFIKALSEARPTYDRTTYKWVYRRGTAEDLKSLSRPEGGLFPSKLFSKRTGGGGSVDPITWMMALRANMRGKLALPQLLELEFEEATNPKGITYRRRKRKPSPDNLLRALDEQDRILDGMLKACPGFFDGLLVEDEPLKEEREEAAAQ